MNKQYEEERKAFHKQYEKAVKEHNIERLQQALRNFFYDDQGRVNIKAANSEMVYAYILFEITAQQIQLGTPLLLEQITTEEQWKTCYYQIKFFIRRVQFKLSVEKQVEAFEQLKEIPLDRAICSVIIEHSCLESQKEQVICQLSRFFWYMGQQELALKLIECCLDWNEESLYAQELIESYTKGEVITKESLEHRVEKLDQSYNKKIEFVICVNDELMFKECCCYIEELVKPEGVSVTVTPVRGADSICSGYEQARKNSNADFLIYMHQDLMLIDSMVLVELLNRFETKEHLGLVGMVGANGISKDGIWWKSNQTYGSVLEDRIFMLQLSENPLNQQRWNKITHADGIFMAARPEVAFPETIFTGWHFYDVAFCEEIAKAGYELEIPYMEEPWALHDCCFENDLPKEYEQFRRVFIEEYLR